MTGTQVTGQMCLYVSGSGKCSQDLERLPGTVEVSRDPLPDSGDDTDVASR